MQPKGGAKAPGSSNMHAWHQMAGSDTGMPRGICPLGMPVLCVSACWVDRQSSNCPVSRWPLALPKRIFAPLSLLQVLVLGAAAAPLHLADADQESLLAGPKGAVACRPRVPPGWPQGRCCMQTKSPSWLASRALLQRHVGRTAHACKPTVSVRPLFCHASQCCHTQYDGAAGLMNGFLNPWPRVRGVQQLALASPAMLACFLSARSPAKLPCVVCAQQWCGLAAHWTCCPQWR
jgi:hypothetical protein